MSDAAKKRDQSGTSEQAQDLLSRVAFRMRKACYCGSLDGYITETGAQDEFGLSDEDINSDDNLCCACDSCNLGMGANPIPLRLAIAILMQRLRGVQQR